MTNRCSRNDTFCSLFGAVLLSIPAAMGCDAQLEADDLGEAALDVELGEDELGEDELADPQLDDAGQPEIHADELADDDDAQEGCFECGYAGPLASVAFPTMCIHKANPGWDNGNPIHLWDCGFPWDANAENKYWFWDTATKMIRAVHNPDKCIHKNWGDANGTSLHVWDCGYPWDADWENKLWELDNGLIKSIRYSDKCIHKGWGGANGTSIALWDCGYPWESNAENKYWFVK